MSSQKVALVVFAIIITVLCELRVEKFEGDRILMYLESLKLLHRGPPVPRIKSSANVPEEWIEQKLDHFDEQETRTWQMRYMVNEEHFKEGGPMFIMVGGEEEISSDFIRGGHFYDMAKEHKAILYQTEHRYYGKSRPTSDMTVDNLKYLHVKQALADLAHFIRHQKANNPALANSKVIMAGGSYEGTMTVWFKRLYPELMTGGWASSAPLFSKVNFVEYGEKVGQALLELGSQQCFDRVNFGFSKLESMLANNSAEEVKKMFNICDGFDDSNELDVRTLFSSILILIAKIVQYQRWDQIPNLCNFLMSYKDEVSALAGLVLRDSRTCLDFSYKSNIAGLMDINYTENSDRQWTYQVCNEFGNFQTTIYTPLEYFTIQCTDVYGEKYNLEYIEKAVAQTNNDFGGMNPEVDHIYMTHGDLDPWSPLGLGAEQGASVFPNASHCQDFDSISADDPEAIRQSKERLAGLVRDWLK